MRKLLLCATLTTLLASCGSSYPVSAPADPCRVPPFPAPLVVTPHGCGHDVCWSLEDTLALTRWAAAVEEYWRGVSRCPLVVEVPPA